MVNDLRKKKKKPLRERDCLHQQLAVTDKLDHRVLGLDIIGEQQTVKAKQKIFLLASRNAHEVSGHLPLTQLNLPVQGRMSNKAGKDSLNKVLCIKVC